MFAKGIEFSTFSITARCPRTGRFGVAITTHAMAVTSRCPWVKSGVGAVTTQASTDPRLGPLGLRLLEMGFSAGKVLRELEASDPYIEHRQLAVVDRDGRAAARTGRENRDWAGHHVGDGFVAMGNALISERTCAAMVEAFQASTVEDLAERLLRAIEAGRDAGGQHDGQRSAGLIVYDREVFPRVDLRVDLHAEPVGELRRIFDEYRPLTDYYTLRAANPTIGREADWRAAHPSPFGRGGR